MEKIFLTGMPGCGKSSVLIKVIEILKNEKLKVGGIITPEIRSCGRRIGFLVKDVFSGKEGILASVEQKEGLKLGKYRVNLKAFEEISLPALDFALKECDVVVIDEIGKMEFFSKKFKEKVFEILKSQKPMLACLHRNFISKFRRYGEIIEVTAANRDSLPNLVGEKLLS